MLLEFGCSELSLIINLIIFVEELLFCKMIIIRVNYFIIMAASCQMSIQGHLGLTNRIVLIVGFIHYCQLSPQNDVQISIFSTIV